MVVLQFACLLSPTRAFSHWFPVGGVSGGCGAFKKRGLDGENGLLRASLLGPCSDLSTLCGMFAEVWNSHTQAPTTMDCVL